MEKVIVAIDEGTYSINPSNPPVWSNYGHFKRGNKGRLIVLQHFLKLDFDGEESEYLQEIERIKTAFHIIGFLKIDDVKIMQTKKGFHTTLKISSKAVQLKPMDMVALQAILGSDWKREAFNFARVKSEVNMLGNAWNVLFTSKWKTNTGELLSSEIERKELEKTFFK